ncbi:MAG: helix-turn-helix domain-containing protein [Acidithiobacillus sp.]|jgi:Helix-turn-helix.|nr:helix-turn-helix domain-containing protein [Acidithiobacillus sp.]
MIQTDYSKWLSQLMAETGETQYSLAAKSGVPQPTIQRILSGETKDPKANTVRKLLRALGRDPNALLASGGPVPTSGTAAVSAPSLERGADGLPFEGSGLTPQQRAMLGIFERLTSSQKEELMRELEAIKRKNEEIIEELTKKRIGNWNGS